MNISEEAAAALDGQGDSAENIRWGQSRPLPTLLPRVIYNALRDHPAWEYDENDRIVCAGPDCGFPKTKNHTIAHWFAQHQKFVILRAIGESEVKFAEGQSHS